MPPHANALLAALEQRLHPLQVEVARAWWAANTAATEENEARHRAAELALRDALADDEAFAAVAGALSAPPADPVERRWLEVLRRQMQPNQLDADLRRRLVELETRVEAVFARHRGEIDGRRVDDNEIADILRSSADGDLRRKAWEASKSVGAAAAGPVVELVHLRNEAARALGFADHYTMALEVEELDEQRLVATLDEVERLTDEPFRAWKAAFDEQRATAFGCPVDDVRPWHHDDVFFQQAPAVDDADLDGWYGGVDLERLTLRTYDGIGLDLAPVMAASDLYGREGKCQHAFCVDIDREGDVRVLCNAVGNERWAETMLHEFGHAAYDRSIDPSLPFALRDAAHILVTEAVAMLFGRLCRDPAWLVGVAGMDAGAVRDLEPALAAGRRAGELVFARWALVVCHFERALYRDPDGDHGRRWWELVERFQLVRPPDDGAPTAWASKIHLAVAPVYYQNYLYGELLASQLQAAVTDAAGGLVDRPDAGRWFVDQVFRAGSSLRWDRLVEDATGQPLTARHFAADLGA